MIITPIFFQAPGSFSCSQLLSFPASEDAALSIPYERSRTLDALQPEIEHRRFVYRGIASFIPPDQHEDKLPWFAGTSRLSNTSNRSASSNASTGQKYSGRGWRTFGYPAAGRHLSRDSTHCAGTASRPHTAPSSAPQMAALVSVSPPRMTVSTTASSRFGA